MSIKVCTKCGEDRDAEKDFAIKYKARNKRSNICKLCHRKYTKAHYSDNKSVYLSKEKTARKILREKVLDKYGRKCAECSCTIEEILELNHINGSGYFERKNGMHRSKMYNEAILIDGKYNLLCRVCNAKHYVQDILGHTGFEVTFNGGIV